MVKIAIDAMGGDNAPYVTVEAAMKAVKKFNDIELTLFGDEKEIKKYLKNDNRITVVHTSEKVDMAEKDPVGVMRRNKNTSMAMSMTACSNNECDAIVSAGATQAMIVGAHLILKRMKGIKRTALAPFIPSIDGNSKLLLDAGANVEIKPEHVAAQVYFAQITLKEVYNIKSPKVGLLNIGNEVGKGREFESEVYKILEEDKNINFGGNIEPKKIMENDFDILVTDGFTGNILLKTMEGSIKGSTNLLKLKIKSSLLSKIGYLFMRKTFKKFKKSLSADTVGGAMLFGIRKPLIKAHGSSNVTAYTNAIRQARDVVEKDIIGKVKNILK